MTFTVPVHCLVKVVTRNSLSSYRRAYRTTSEAQVSNLTIVFQRNQGRLGGDEEHRLMQGESTARSNSQGSGCQLSVQVVGLSTPADTNVNVVNIHQSGSFLTS